MNNQKLFQNEKRLNTDKTKNNNVQHKADAASTINNRDNIKIFSQTQLIFLVAMWNTIVHSQNIHSQLFLEDANVIQKTN